MCTHTVQGLGSVNLRENRERCQRCHHNIVSPPLNVYLSIEEEPCLCASYASQASWVKKPDNNRRCASASTTVRVTQGTREFSPSLRRPHAFKCMRALVCLKRKRSYSKNPHPVIRNHTGSSYSTLAKCKQPFQQVCCMFVYSHCKVLGL